MLETLRSAARQPSTRPATPTLGDDATPSTTPPSLRSWDRAAQRRRACPGGPSAPSSTTCAAVTGALDSPSAGDADLALRIIAALATNRP